MLRKHVSYLVFLIAIGLLLVSCVAPATLGALTGATQETPPEESASNTITAMKVDAVSLDHEANYWGSAPQLTVATVGAREGDPDGPDVNVQAVYDDGNIAMRFEWADETETVLKNAWTWDGKAFTKSGDEDRVMLAWPIENNADFAAKGCAVLCHNMADDDREWWMGTDSDDLRLDVWHWKAARTNPVGQADDKWWGTQTDPSDPKSSRHGDAKDSGGYSNNRNEEGDGPAFVHRADSGTQFIVSGDEVDIELDSIEADTVIPGYIVSPFVGSRGDIAANGVWADGKWVVVLMRPFDTGNDDDVVFTPPKAYPLGLSIVDNGGGLDHTNALDVLTLEWQ